MNREEWIWKEKAACRGIPIHIFFPEETRNRKEYYEIAKEVCTRCPVTEECYRLSLEFVTSGDRQGVFGGLTPAERRLRRSKEAWDEWERKQASANEGEEPSASV